MLKFANDCICFVKQDGWNGAQILEALEYDVNEKLKVHAWRVTATLTDKIESKADSDKNIFTL